MLEAHYSAGKRPTLDIASTVNGQRSWHAIGIKVSGKREARQLAKQYSATPWNF